jgi:ferredoxin
MGYGVCVTHSDQLFALDGDTARVLLDAVPADLVQLAGAAVSECPSGAIKIEDQ